MKKSALKGLCFGLTSGIITTLGMIVGLNSGTGSKMVVLGGIVSIAIADSLSDALGIHISEESDKTKNEKEIWTATISTFISKLVFSSTFIIPILLMNLKTAIIASIIWGFTALTLLSYFIAKDKKEKPLSVIGEHLIIAAIVIFLTHYAGKIINTIFI